VLQVELEAGASEGGALGRKRRGGCRAGATMDSSPSLGNHLNGRKEVLPFPFLLTSHLPSSLVGFLQGQSSSGARGLFFLLLCSHTSVLLRSQAVSLPTWRAVHYACPGEERKSRRKASKGVVILRPSSPFGCQI